MSDSPPVSLRGALRSLADSPRFIHGFAVVTVATFVLAWPIRRLIGWAGFGGALVMLSAIAITLLWARGDQRARWRVSVTLVAFVALASLSTLWSAYPAQTLGGAGALALTALLGFSLATLRDNIQVVRAFGSVLRVTLAAALVLEIAIGVVGASSFPLLGLQGNLDELGPIQGLWGSRGTLGALALVASVTFSVEWLTRSVPRIVAGWSVAGAVTIMALTRSPVVLAVALATIMLGVVITSVRRAERSKARSRRVVMFAIAGVIAVLAFLFRSQLLTLLSGGREYLNRESLWTLAVSYTTEQRPWAGFGWTGPWPQGVWPYTHFEELLGRDLPSGSSSLIDAYVQLGLIGLTVVIGMLATVVYNAWNLERSRRGAVGIWSALVVSTLAVFALVDSVGLIDWGMLIIAWSASRALPRPDRPVPEPTS